MNCNSDRMWPRCSLWRPVRPPLCMWPSRGRVSVASASTSPTLVVPGAAQRRRIDGDAGLDQRALDRVGLEHLAGIGPQIVERSLRPRVAVLGAVAEADRSTRRHGAGDRPFPSPPWRRWRRAVSSLDRASRSKYGIGEGGVEQLPHHRIGEVAVGLLDQQQVAVVAGIAQIGERVLVAALAFDLAGIGVERAGLADQVETHIAEGQVLLDHRRMADPFGQPMAEDQRRVGEAAACIGTGVCRSWCSAVALVAPSS